MIERDADVPDYFLVLERKDSFGEYARAYGERLAEHYENLGVIVVPHMPIDFDLEFCQQVAFPRGWKKIGTLNGIERPVVTRGPRGLEVASEHPFVANFGDLNTAIYLQAQIARFNAQLRHGMSVLFPRYRSMYEGNITWRLQETLNQGLHLDSFGRGAPVHAGWKVLHRVKIFVNIDSEPRRWRTSLDLPSALHACRDKLPIELPADVNVVNDIINKFGVLAALPAHRIAYPCMSALIVNGEALAHDVVYGRRMVAGEFGVHQADMLDPRKLSHGRIRGWLEASEYTVAEDAAAIHARYADMGSSYQADTPADDEG